MLLFNIALVCCIDLSYSLFRRNFAPKDEHAFRGGQYSIYPQTGVSPGETLYMKPTPIQPSVHYESESDPEPYPTYQRYSYFGW